VLDDNMAEERSVKGLDDIGVDGAIGRFPANPVVKLLLAGWIRWAQTTITFEDPDFTSKSEALHQDFQNAVVHVVDLVA